MNTNQFDKGGTGPRSDDQSALKSQEIRELEELLSDEWRVEGEKRLERTFQFNDFAEALEFTNRVGDVAEHENHHPDVHLGYGKVDLKLSTHSAGGLTKSDFVLAQKIDRLSV